MAVEKIGFTPGEGNAVTIILPSEGTEIQGYLDGPIQIGIENKYETIFEGGIGSLITSIAKLAAQLNALPQIFNRTNPQYVKTRLIVFNSPLLYAGTNPIAFQFSMWIVGGDPMFSPPKYRNNFNLFQEYIHLLRAASPSSVTTIATGVSGPQAITVQIGGILLSDVLLQNVIANYGDPPLYDVSGKPVLGKVNISLTAQRVYSKEDIDKIFSGGTNA